MNVLSLFDGISCARVALERAGINVSSYTAYEIDSYAVDISKKNYPSIVHCGNVKDCKEAMNVDLLIGGSPCQDLSIAKKDRKGLDGERSSLFWEYLRVKNLCRPRWFILENVASMRSVDRDVITRELGVEPILFDASLVSAQSRRRLFWTNIPFELPTDQGKILADILDPTIDSYIIRQNYTEVESTRMVGYLGKSKSQANRIYNTDGKSVCLSANGGGLGAKTGLYKVNDIIRKLTPVECERLQGLPDGYTEGISQTQRYKCLGNAFNVDVVAHIVRGIRG
jgi:DNA (cytosine-5)-methyltransferase 3A